MTHEFLAKMDASAERLQLLAQAEAEHAQYPQYKNFWNLWVVGTVKKDVKTKLGLAFRKGDRVLVQPEIRDSRGQSFARRSTFLSVTAYSFRNKCNTSVWLTDIDVDSSTFPVVTI